MAENKVFQGERFSFEGVLKIGGVVTNSYTMTYQLISLGGRISQEYPISHEGNVYYGTIDTSGLQGQVQIRFIVKDSDGKVVSNQNIAINVIQ